MKRLAGFLFFLIPLILCTIFARPLYEERIEKDLTQKVRSILLEQGLDPSELRIENHHLIEIGEQESGDFDRAELLRELDTVAGLYVGERVLSHRVLKPPYFSLVERADQSVLLKGVVRDESEREFLGELVARPAKEGEAERVVENMLEVSSEVSRIVAKEKLSDFTPDFLAATEKGSLVWSPSEFEIGGLLDDAAQEEAVLAKVAEASPDISPVNELLVQPYQAVDFGFERNHENIVVTGLLPDAATRDRLLRLVQRESRGVYLQNKTTLAIRPLPAWWSESPETLLPALLSTTKGMAKVHYFPDRFIAEATFDERSDYDVVKAEIEKFPKEIQRASNLKVVKKVGGPSYTPRNNPLKAEALISRLKDKAVYFASSSAWIKEREKKKIKESARLILNSKNVTQGLTVGGYADLRGNAAYNRRLSLKRAEAVRDQLIKEGVPAERLSVKHFGEDTSKTAKKNLWKSRRVEISLTLPTKETER